MCKYREKYTETGGDEFMNEQIEITYPFDRYNVKVAVSPTHKFIGITEIKLNKDFRSYKQKITPKGYHDVDEYYPD